MSSPTDGQILEAALGIIESNLKPNLLFGAPALSISLLARSLGLSPSDAPRQCSGARVCSLLEPVALTLFGSPKRPETKTLARAGKKPEEWIVFQPLRNETSGRSGSASTSTSPLKVRQTLVSPPIGNQDPAPPLLDVVPPRSKSLDRPSVTFPENDGRVRAHTRITLPQLPGATTFRDRRGAIISAPVNVSRRALPVIGPPALPQGSLSPSPADTALLVGIDAHDSASTSGRGSPASGLALPEEAGEGTTASDVLDLYSLDSPVPPGSASRPSTASSTQSRVSKEKPDTNSYPTTINTSTPQSATSFVFDASSSSDNSSLASDSSVPSSPYLSPTLSESDLTPFLAKAFEDLPFEPGLSAVHITRWVNKKWAMLAAEMTGLFVFAYILQAMGV